MSLPYDKSLIPLAKALRKNMTPQEKKLWYEFLKEYPIRFQRQKAIAITSQIFSAQAQS
jgi:very-short-patch-repair endonuclease